MRWKHKESIKEGDIRIKSKYLIIPKCIDKEYRWLEKVTYQQEYTKIYVYEYFIGDILFYYYFKWKDVKWID